jgi:hypothetical protein
MWRVITATCTHSYPTRNHSYPTCKHSYPTHCCETPALRPLDSHSSPRLPTAPATAACHLLSPSGPSRSGGPNVGCSNTPALIRLRMYDIGGARRRRWSVRVLRKVNVPTQSQLSEHVRDIARGGTKCGVTHRSLLRSGMARRQRSRAGAWPVASSSAEAGLRGGRLSPHEPKRRGRMSLTECKCECQYVPCSIHRDCAESHPRSPLFAASTPARSESLGKSLCSSSSLHTNPFPRRESSSMSLALSPPWF